MNKSKYSFLIRSITAIAFYIGMYILSFTIIGILAYIPFLLWAMRETKFYGLISAASIAGAIIIFWSILPKFDRFKPPGPEIKLSNHPYLLSLIKDLSSQLDQKMPSKVYLINEMNGWVANRGGIIGIGSKRVLVLGLPLLGILNTSEFKALLIHEIGHFYGKDTTLSPFIYRTRYSLTQMINQLEKRVPALSAPFFWYSKIFLRLTESISRDQELVADKLAAKIAGSNNAIQALEKIYGAESVFIKFFEKEVEPIVKMGYTIPITEGFQQYLKSQPIINEITKNLDSAVETNKILPYDSHPPVKLRLKLLRDLNIDSLSEKNNAASLFNEIDKIELELIRFIFNDSLDSQLNPLRWAEVPKIVLIPAWKDITSQCQDVFLGMKPIDLLKFSDLEYFKMFSRRLGIPNSPLIDPNKPNQAIVIAIGAAFAVQLYKKGWQVSYQLGENISFEHNNFSIEPFNVLDDFLTESIVGNTWLQLCKDADIENIDLGKL